MIKLSINCINNEKFLSFFSTQTPLEILQKGYYKDIKCKSKVIKNNVLKFHYFLILLKLLKNFKIQDQVKNISYLYFQFSISNLQFSVYNKVNRLEGAKKLYDKLIHCKCSEAL